ncbi:MAG TPA: RNA polymerase factor sigma-54 [Terriglobales bacterium]|nr:RNA polymerase factor sigma-54 [Terriglobales bacterium]
MVLLQHKLSLRVSQKQILTPGLVQMVSVLALNKIELKDMINAEMVENPVLEELDGTVPLLDDVAGRAEDRERSQRTAEEADPVVAVTPKDPFEEIDFGSFFQDYLDPGYRTSSDVESVEKPSFENFLSKPSTLTDHLMWQLGASHVNDKIRAAAELVIGNLNEDGYLIATEDELMAQAYPSELLAVSDSEASAKKEASSPLDEDAPPVPSPALFADDEISADRSETYSSAAALSAEKPLFEPQPHAAAVGLAEETLPEESPSYAADSVADMIAAVAVAPEPEVQSKQEFVPPAGIEPVFTLEDLRAATDLIRQMDPVGVASRDLRECLLAQLHYHQRVKVEHDLNGGNGTSQVLKDAVEIVSNHLRLVQNKQLKEIAKAIGGTPESVQAALDYIRTLDPKPGLRYNIVEPRLIEPDVAFIKQGDEYQVVLNDDDVPQLRLNTSYKRLLNRDAAEKDVRSYVKERYKSAIQLIKNIEQRKQTILKVCHAVVGRQREFLDQGIDYLKPMMIKEVAEEIGVHPSTVSRAVANKYAHTAQGVFELRYFFSESVQGPEGGNTSLLILKRRVKKLIEEEDPARPLTDEQITRILQSQGIQVTRRTVAKYREDMKIPSTHQRRVKN